MKVSDIPLIILHGALGSADQFTQIENELKNCGQSTLRIEFPGHGKRAGEDFIFSINNFAEEVLNILEEQNIHMVNIFGYSMGGYVALLLAKNYPEKVKNVVTLATKFNWTKETAEEEVKMLDPDLLVEKFPGFANTLTERHGKENWKNVLRKTAGLMKDLGQSAPLNAENYKLIQSRVLLTVGDKDRMVSIEETEKVSRLIPEAEIKILPDCKHPIEMVDISQVVKNIIAFI